MGCVQNLDYRKIISKYNDYSSLFPKWKKPIILGLPATKGTKTIERAFKPLIELDTWMNDFEQSDYAQRRYNLYTKKVNIIDNVTNAIEEVRAYKPANMLFKILNNKLPTYRLYLPHKIHKDITDIVNDISIKFPTVSKSYNPWARTSPTGLRQWSKDVAVFTNQLTPGY
jgi:transposase